MSDKNTHRRGQGDPIGTGGIHEIRYVVGGLAFQADDLVKHLPQFVFEANDSRPPRHQQTTHARPFAAGRPAQQPPRQRTADQGFIRPRVRRLMVAGRARIVRLEDELWEVFDEIASLEGQSVDDLADLVDAARADGISLTSAMRIFIAHYLMSRSLRA